MRVFVLTTGRSGSTTFARAAGHFDNFTAAHESRWGVPRLSSRLDYPDQHIEVDNRLAWMLGMLEQQYGDDPDVRWVHLIRNEEACANSFVEWQGQLLEKVWMQGILGLRATRRMQPFDQRVLALDMVRTINLNIGMFLARREHTREMHLEQATEEWPAFCEWIGATGNLAASTREWSCRYNAS